MRPRTGAILLEVLVSVGLMAFGLAIVGLRVTTSLDTARRTEFWTTAIVLAENKIAELQAGAVAFNSTDDQIAGYFGIRYPGYSWRIKIEPCEIENLHLMTLEIGYNASVIEDQIENPDQEIDFEDPGTLVVRTVHRLVPTPADLDLNRDFGIDMEKMQEQMGGGGEGEGGEGGSGDAAGSELWALINEFLTRHPEILNDNGGIDLEAVKNLPAEDFQMAMQILEQFVGRGSQLSQLQNQLGDALGEGDQAGGSGGGGRGGRGGNAGGQPAGGRGGQNDVDGGSGTGGRGRGNESGRDGGRDAGRDGGRDDGGMEDDGGSRDGERGTGGARGGNRGGQRGGDRGGQRSDDGGAGRGGDRGQDAGSNDRGDRGGDGGGNRGPGGERGRPGRGGNRPANNAGDEDMRNPRPGGRR